MVCQPDSSLSFLCARDGSSKLRGFAEARFVPIRLTQTPTTYRGGCALDATAEMGGKRTYSRLISKHANL